MSAVTGKLDVQVNMTTQCDVPVLERHVGSQRRVRVAEMEAGFREAKLEKDGQKHQDVAGLSIKRDGEESSPRAYD